MLQWWRDAFRKRFNLSLRGNLQSPKTERKMSYSSDEISRILGIFFQDQLLGSLYIWALVFEGQTREGGETRREERQQLSGGGREEVFRRGWADQAGVSPQSSVGLNISSTASSRFGSRGKTKTRQSSYFRCHMNERRFFCGSCVCFFSFRSLGFMHLYFFFTSVADFPAYCWDQCCIHSVLVEMNNSIVITAAVWLQRRQSHQVGWEVRLLVHPDSNILTTIGGTDKKVFTDIHSPQKINLTDTGDSVTCHQSYCRYWINLPVTTISATI